MAYNFARRQDIEATLAMVRKGTPRQLLPKQGVKEKPKITKGMIFHTPSGGIPARSGTTCGSAECVPYYIDADGELLELTDNNEESQEATVYHIGSSDVAGSTYIQAKYIFNKWVVDMEDCG